MKRLITLMIFTGLLPLCLLAQFATTGQILDEQDQPLPFANVLLLSAVDSSLVKGEFSLEDGTFNLSYSTAGSYLLSISVIGYSTYYSAVFQLDQQNPTQDFSNIQLNPAGIALEAVEVKASQPMFERKIDRTVINLQRQVLSAGANALEVLERAPGVRVNRSSNTIGLLGKNGVNVMINGKLNYMPTDALLQFLEGLDAGTIDKIELITTPPARFDAQGNAGYINIVLKKNPEEGWQGNYSLSAGYGRGAVFNGSGNLYYRQEKFSLFGNYAYTRNEQPQFSETNRQINQSLTELTSMRDPIRNNHNARIGIDLQLKPSTSLGAVVSGYRTHWDMDATNDIRQGPKLDTSIISQVDEINLWRHIQSNVYLNHQFQGGHQISADFDYLYYYNDNPSGYDFTYSTEQGIFQRERIDSGKESPFSLRVGQVNYQSPSSRSLQFSGGLKYVDSDFENEIDLRENNKPITDLSSTSTLREQIFASYFEVDYAPTERLKLKGGLRYEYTDTNLESTDENQVVDRSFGELFPSLFASYQINERQQLAFSYSKRINRPSFSDMAPFILFLDPNTSYSGNAALQPAIAHTLQTDYRLGTVNLVLQYTYEDSTIVRYQNRFDPENNTQLIVPDNLVDQHTFSATLAFPLQVTPWWDMRLTTSYLWQESTSIEDLGQYTIRQHSVRWNGQQSFRLPHNFNIELSGFYQTKELAGNVTFDFLSILNLGIRKSFANQSKLTFSITDIFNALKRAGTTRIPNENVFVERTFDFSQRTFRLSFSSTFGNQKVNTKTRQKRDRSAEKRVN